MVLKDKAYEGIDSICFCEMSHSYLTLGALGRGSLCNSGVQKLFFLSANSNLYVWQPGSSNHSAMGTLESLDMLMIKGMCEEFYSRCLLEIQSTLIKFKSFIQTQCAQL